MFVGVIKNVSYIELSTLFFVLSTLRTSSYSINGQLTYIASYEIICEI